MTPPPPRVQKKKDTSTSSKKGTTKKTAATNSTKKKRLTNKQVSNARNKAVLNLEKIYNQNQREKELLSQKKMIEC